ncbi:hypothetical protein Glove_84g37 [Diversispora epigaea]|uniref:Serine-threonine/tyrosine-protein kinase catalytic domain-containing protein n=1 Tax=Diversispora epigaea TaxID=1348612 RepID=A0A397JE30_9GLOM|nr:hypothetical protein Glove_84g37 [Diversispora epigaea]
MDILNGEEQHFNVDALATSLDNFLKKLWREEADGSFVQRHKMGLMHKDFYSGNIVNQTLTGCYFSDFGLCKPVTENDRIKFQFMALEILDGEEYIQACNYSFDMVMLEVLTSHPPYYNIPHNANLVMDICKGFKPEINRPTAEELKSQLDKYSYGGEIRAANKSNKNFIKYNPNKMHPEAIYISRLIPKLPKLAIPEYDTLVEDEDGEDNETHECKFNSLEIN